jgi:sialate O-acetylesterase
MLPALIKGWRGAWGQGDIPFIIVQLPNFSTPRPLPGDSEWAELREAQALTTATVPNTSLVVTIDLGDKSNLHPPDKLDVGQRLALAARAHVYKENVEASGPVYDSMSVNGAEAHIQFKHVDGGLVVKGDRPIQGFAVAGADRKFEWAQARLDGDSVIVSSQAVPDPVAVRYAWADNPFTNLYNKAGLPVAPFRTDDWPLATANCF